MVDSLHSLCWTSFIYIRLWSPSVALWELGADRWASLESVHPLWPVRPSQHESACQKNTKQKKFPPWQKSVIKKTTDNRNTLACNDHHLVHHLITMFFFPPIKKDYLVVLGHSRWVNSGEVSEGGTCERWTEALAASPPQRLFLRLQKLHCLLVCILMG